MQVDIIELLVDELNPIEGINAMSLVDRPAIESDFVMFKKEDGAEKKPLNEVQFVEMGGEQRIVLGPAAIPNLMIYREREDGSPYYNYYSRDTLKKAVQKFFRNGNQNNITLQHEVSVGGITIFESWIVEDSDKDKSTLYGFNLPVGTWMIAAKVDDEGIWNDFVKTGSLKGFSLEGFFSDSEKQMRKRLKSAFNSLLKLKLNAKDKEA